MDCDRWRPGSWTTLICQFPSFRQTIFRTSAALAGTAARQFLALKRQASGLSWVIAAPDRVTLWHGDCALAGIEGGDRGSTEMHKGILTMAALIISRPGMIAVLLSVSLAGLSGCGSAAPDYSPSLESRASLGIPSKSQSVIQHPWAPGKGLSTPAASSVTSAASNYTQATTQEEPAPLPEHLSLPIWIAQALDAPEASVRIQALDMWAQQGAQAPLDPLVVALDDENDDVRTKAMAIIEQHWAINQKSETEK